MAKPGLKAQKLVDGHGLLLYVSPIGAKVWRMAYRREGKLQTATFGPYPLVTLAEARLKRDELRKAVLASDPVKTASKRDAFTLTQAREQ